MSNLESSSTESQESRRQRAGHSDASPDPSEVRNLTDPGDATSRNFRYQHAYGVMLLVAAKRGLRPYWAIWCEQHEDFLAQRHDGLFDGYQIKTARPELGTWTLKDGEFTKSIGRFVDLVAEFGDRIGELYFVSNTDFDTVTSASRDDKRRGRCPRLFLECIRGCRSRADIAPPFDGTFDELLAECSCDPDDLVAVLHRVNLILGPSRSEFDAALSHEHLAQLGDCRSYNAQQLDSLRNNLVAVVYRASSLQVTDPIRHLRPMIDARDPDPVLSAKRIVVAEVEFFLSQTPSNPVFCFPDEPVLELGRGLSGVIEQKLSAAGLELEIDYLCDRARAAEYNLLEDVVRRPEAFPKLLRQIEQRVHGEVSEAHLHARQQPAPYGPTMLMDVQNRLRHLAVDRPADVGYHGYECLIGVAGLLTDECRVWWGPRFPIRVEAIS